MHGLEYVTEDVRKFHDLAAPWNISTRFERSGVSRFSALPPDYKPTSLASFLQAFTTSSGSDPRVTVLNEVWRDIESNGYYKALMKNKDYRSAREKFEKQLRQTARDKGPFEEIDKRITFTYVTGDLIHHRLVVTLPVRLEPEKPTARSAIVHIDALLDAYRNGIGPFFGDYQLETNLRQLRAKLTTVLESRRVENTMSPDNFFVFMLAKWFISIFGRAMPTVISDLCSVVGYEPDKSTIERWVEKAREHPQGKPKTA